MQPQPHDPHDQSERTRRTETDPVREIMRQVRDLARDPTEVELAAEAQALLFRWQEIRIARKEAELQRQAAELQRQAAEQEQQRLQAEREALAAQASLDEPPPAPETPTEPTPGEQDSP